MDQDDITEELTRSFRLRMTNNNLGLRRQDGMMKLVFVDDEPSPVQQSAAFGQMVEAQEQFQPKDSELPTPGKMLEDIGEMAKGTGRAVLGGVREAGQGFLDMTGELGEVAEGILPAGYIVFDEQGLQYTGEKPEDMQQLELPEVPKGDSAVENLARGAVQFAAGMAAAPVRGLGYGTMMLRSGFADALFDPEEGNLATAINELGLGNEFTELIDSKVGEDAEAAEKLKARLINSGLGMITGAVADAVIGAVRLARGDPELKGTIKRSLRPVQEYAAGAEQRIAERSAARGRTLGAGIDPTEIVDETIVAIQKLSGGATGKRTKTGQYVGAPPGLDSPQKLASLRRKMEQFTIQGEPGRFWYERSSKAILDAVGGDVEDADKLVQAVAILSAGTPVKSNMDFALQAFSQWKAGEPIRTGMFPTAMSKRLEEVFSGNPWEGRKTNNFYVNLMREIDPSRVQGVTTDIHMMRAFGFDKEVPTTAQYDFVEKEVKRIADKLGWEPQQVQAAIWVTQKAKKENRPAEMTKYDFADAIAENLGQVSWESIPGRTSSHMPEMFNAPMEQQSEYHVAASKAFLDDDGNDILAKHLGIVSPGDFEAPGYFEGKTSPGTQTQVALPRQYKGTGQALDPSALKLVNKYAAMRGLLLKQDASAWHRPFYKAKVADMNGMNIDIGRTFNESEISRLGKILFDLSGDPYLAPISTDKGVRVVNFDPSVNNKEFLKMVRKAADQLELDDGAGANLTRFATEGNYFDNDWSRSANGEDYLRYIRDEGSSDLSAGDRAVLEKIQSRIDDIDADFSVKYGWTLNDRINANFRRQASEVKPMSPEQTSSLIISGDK